MNALTRSTAPSHSLTLSCSTRRGTRERQSFEHRVDRSYRGQSAFHQPDVRHHPLSCRPTQRRRQRLREQRVNAGSGGRRAPAPQRDVRMERSFVRCKLLGGQRLLHPPLQSDQSAGGIRHPQPQHRGATGMRKDPDPAGVDPTRRTLARRLAQPRHDGRNAGPRDLPQKREGDVRAVRPHPPHTRRVTRQAFLQRCQAFQPRIGHVHRREAPQRIRLVGRRVCSASRPHAP